LTKIIFIGDKPSLKNTNPDVPFVGTVSYKTLLKWFKILNLNENNYTIYNSHNLTCIETIKNTYNINNKYIALGNEASKRLDKLNIKHFKLPHPSGRNRLLNDKFKINEILSKCIIYLQN